MSTLKKYFCETCDKSFRTDDDLILHEADHETCGREGCEFTAHPKIIAKHIRMQHDSGLYKRIGKLYTEEEIAKWIEERKKRYPSRKVIEEKKILEQEKIERGEKINNDDSRFNKSFQTKNKRIKKPFEKRAQNLKKRSRKKKNVPAMQEVEDDSSSRKGVPAFLGIKKSCDTEEPEKIDDLDISDEEWEPQPKVKETPQPILNNSLGLLAASYDSDGDVFDEEPQTKSSRLSGDEGSGPEEVKTVSSRTALQQEVLEERISRKRKSGGKTVPFNKRRVNDYRSENRSLTLLEKLLKNEIRHERNVILQCIHYVVKNNFFKS